MSSPKWTPADLPDLDSRTVVVTGATSGIGKVAAAEFARAGARTVLAVRDTERGEQAAAEMNGTTEVRPLDLADLASVRAFASSWTGDIDILVNNAGVMAVPEGRTKDGFETQFGTNHLGHFALTGLLIGHVRDRVVTIASSAHRSGKINLDDLNWENGYKRWPAYGQSKLANLLFTLELQRRLEQAGSPVIAVAAHPGYSATHLQSRTGNFVQNTFMAITNRLIAQSDVQGAWPTLYAATHELPGNSYIGPDGLLEARGHPKIVGRTSAAKDADVARKLWTLSEELTGVPFSLPAAA